MYIDYSKLWKLLIDKKMKKKDLAAITGLSSSMVSKPSFNQNANTEVLVKIGYALQCDITEIVIMEDNP